MLNLQTIDTTWTLFLDRDGVINEEKEDSYIFHYGEFHFYEGALEALKRFAGVFGHIVIVTNQRGVGKGLMSAADLQNIHDEMIMAIVAHGGRIDRIYFADSLDNAHPLRKPQPGMAHAAQRDLPEIDFTKCIMIGNNISDMEFGRNAGMYTVFLTTTNPGQVLPHVSIDLAFSSLYDFAKHLRPA